MIFFCEIEIHTYEIIPFKLAVDQPKDPEYNNFGKYGANGTRNLYVGVKDFYNEKTNINLGVWHLVPENLIPATNNPNFDYDESLLNSRYPVVIYFHGQAATRIQALPTYLVLRKYFHVIVFDYRNYGDSTEAQLSEVAVVNDGIQFYNWLMTKTHSDIYVWGHSLGCGISTHTVARLKDYNIVPKGLVLEAPFSNLQDEVYNHPIAKVGTTDNKMYIFFHTKLRIVCSQIFTWLPWFKATISDPLEQNGFIFDNTKNIIKVDCPILIMNSQDDPVIPYKLGKKVFGLLFDHISFIIIICF